MSRATRRRLPSAAACLLASLAASAAPAMPARVGESVAPRVIASHVRVCANMNLYPRYNDIWGYTSPSGQEYALLGTVDGVSIVNITDRLHPHEVLFVNGPHSAWRDIKVYRDTMYIVNETDGGLQIVSLVDAEHPRPVAAYAAFRTAHNLYVEFENAALYVAGSNLGNGGVQILSLIDPQRPRPAGSWDLQYAHDVYVRGDTMFVSAIRVASLYIIDISTRHHPSMTIQGIISNYPYAATHNCWVNDAGTHVITTDEIAGGIVRLWDITQLPSSSLSGTYHPDDSASIPHNVLVDDGDLAYISHYTAGVRVVDVSNPSDPVEVAFYDTYPSSESGIFAGCWGVFPFYPNSPGLFVASDIQTGLWVFELDRDLIDPSTRARIVSAIRAARPAAAATRSGAAGPGERRSAGAAAMHVSAPAPNPLGPGARARLDLALPTPAVVRADVVDAAGRLVRRLLDGTRGAGSTSIAWDGRDAQGDRAAAGVYFLRVSDGKTTQSRRVVVTQ
ncbi:MAG: choice-of-anchor B family protein [bacterium]